MEKTQTKFNVEAVKKLRILEETHKGLIKIWVAQHKEDIVVIKEIDAAYLDTEIKKQHAVNERLALSSLNHPGIISLFDYQQDDKKLQLFLDLAEGTPLHKLLRTNPKGLDPNFVKLVGAQLALILKHVHENGFLYRDIKASNVIVNSEGQVKLVDFGFAKKIERGRTNTICGTLHAMAPELLNESAIAKSGYSYEVDVYSYGVFLYELLTGTSPFGYQSEEESAEVISKRVKIGITGDQLSLVSDPQAKLLIQCLLDRYPDKRLGAIGGFTEILKHPYFEKVNLEELKTFASGEKTQDLLPRYWEDYKIGYYEEDIYITGTYKSRERSEIENAPNDPFADL